MNNHHEEILNDWTKVINVHDLFNVMHRIYDDRKVHTPGPDNVLRAFQLCPLNECRVVMIGQDPYPQKGVATGVLFGNKPETTDLSPSLRTIIDCVVPDDKRNGFDITLESWAKQGILMLNSSLTCVINNVGSDFSLWRPFISNFLLSLSSEKNGLVYALFGNTAVSLKKFIHSGAVLTEKHPAYFARAKKRMPDDIFVDINKMITGEPIDWLSQK